MDHERLSALLINYVNAYIRVHDCEDDFVYKWEVSALEAAEKAIHDAFDKVKYAPLGDNHHNAIDCPYCNPRK